MFTEKQAWELIAEAFEYWSNAPRLLQNVIHERNSNYIVYDLDIGVDRLYVDQHISYEVWNDMRKHLLLFRPDWSTEERCRNWWSQSPEGDSQRTIAAQLLSELAS